MIGEDVLCYVQERLPDFEPTGEPVRLPEGNLNFVWRVPGEPASIICKFAPPYIAANPDISLDPSRLVFEARSLDVLAPGGALAHVSSDAVRPPRSLDASTEPHVLLMEDVGPHPTLGPWLRTGWTDDEVGAVGRRLGRFIGQLHAESTGDEHLAEAFNNRPMQATRLRVQYETVDEMLERAGIEDAATLGARAIALGERLLAPGICLTMGDLWPPSVLVAGERLRVIDWELAHFGQPMQDVAHLAAHLWMQAHRAPNEHVAHAARRLRGAFLTSYRAAVTPVADRLITPQARIDAAVHFGAEVLVRTVGGFQDGYLYAGLAPDASPVREATEVAASHLRAPEVVDTFDALL